MLTGWDRELGVLQVLRLGRGEWVWIRRNQSGDVVLRSPVPLRSRWQAERAARRANGSSLRMVRGVLQPLRRT